jgi:hypothetical protein
MDSESTVDNPSARGLPIRPMTSGSCSQHDSLADRALHPSASVVANGSQEDVD